MDPLGLIGCYRCLPHSKESLSWGATLPITKRFQFLLFVAGKAPNRFVGWVRHN